MKTNFKVIDSDDIHQYDIIVTNEPNQDYPVRYDLHASSGADWSHEAKCKLFLTVTDTGDAFELNKKIKKLDYDVAEELVILLKFINYHYSTRGGILNEKYHILECVTVLAEL